MMPKRNLKKTLSVLAIPVVIFSFILLQTAFAETLPKMPKVVEPGYRIQSLMPKTEVNGFNGLAFDSQGNLYGGVVQGSTTYKIDKETGEISTFILPPEGGADDLVFEPGGRVFWTAFFLGKVFVRGADGKILTFAEGLPGANAIARSKDGRVFFTQVFMGDALWELDLSGQKKNRKIAEKLGGLNAFQVHTDGFIYGPRWFKGDVVKINIETDEVTTISDGFQIPAAVKFDSKGNLYVIDNKAGELIRVDIKTGKKTLVAKLVPHLDNLAIDAQDRIFISTNGDGSIFEVVAKDLALPVYMAKAGSDAVYVTEFLSGKLTKVNLKTGEKSVVTSGLRKPKGVAVMPDGTILVVNVGTKELLQIDPKTGSIKPLVQDLPVGLFVPKNFLPAFTLSGVAVSKAGNIYVTSDTENVIYKISPNK